MPCQYCMKYSSDHHPSCPNYETPKASHYCDVCGEGIYVGEEYIVNDNGEYRHYECFQGMRDLLEWLGYEIKTMEDKNEKY